MTTARELVRAATAAGAKLAMIGDKLSVTAPRPLAPELVEELRRAKGEILRLLAAEPSEGHQLPAKATQWRRQLTIRAMHWALSGKWTKAEAERIALWRAARRMAQDVWSKVAGLAVRWLR